MTKLELKVKGRSDEINYRGDGGERDRDPWGTKEEVSKTICLIIKINMKN